MLWVWGGAGFWTAVQLAGGLLVGRTGDAACWGLADRCVLGARGRLLGGAQTGAFAASWVRYPWAAHHTLSI
jgi:hypothetical protein